MNTRRFLPCRLGMQQRLVPTYRVLFFKFLAEVCEGGLSVFAGQPLPQESIPTAHELQIARYFPARNHHFQHPQSPMYLCWQAGLRSWLESWDPETLIVEANPRYLSTRLAVHWMRKRNRPVLGWGLGVTRLGTVIERLWRQSFLRSLDGVIAYSHRGAAQYRALGLNQVFVAPNAVTPRPAAPPPDRPANFHGPPVVLFVGRLQARKRVDILIKACAALPDNLQPRLIIVGSGPAQVDFQAIARKIYPATEFPGAVFGSDLTNYFTQADLFALPGTGGLAVQQAMAHGLPVIVAKGDGTQDDLVRQENGWQVPPGDQQAFTNALRQALSDPATLRRMGAESFRIVHQEINLETMVDAFVFAVNQVLNPKRS